MRLECAHILCAMHAHVAANVPKDPWEVPEGAAQTRSNEGGRKGSRKKHTWHDIGTDCSASLFCHTEQPVTCHTLEEMCRVSDPQMRNEPHSSFRQRHSPTMAGSGLGVGVSARIHELLSKREAEPP